MPTEPSPRDDQPGYALLRSPAKIVFGDGQAGGLGAAVAELGRRALVCTDARMSATPEFDALLAGIRDTGVAVRVFVDVQPEVPAGSVVDCAALVAPFRPDVVVGIGGGSCIDHAKVVSVLLRHGGRPSDYYGELTVPGPIVPVVAVPTTAGTGSEVTAVAVLADPDRELKVGMSSPYLIPHTALVDPELSHGCPPTLTAHSGADALAHCVEAFTAVRRLPTPALAGERVFVGKSLLTDQYALAGIELIGASLERAYRDGTDRQARTDLQLAALYGGLALSTAGTAAAHALQYPVGALTGTSHGCGVGVLLPYVMEYNLPDRIAEFGRIARALHLPRATGDLDTARAAITGVEDLLASVGIPRDLGTLGVPADRLDWVAEMAMSATRLVQNNPRPLRTEALRLIVGSAFAGDRNVLRAATNTPEGEPGDPH